MNEDRVTEDCALNTVSSSRVTRPYRRTPRGVSTPTLVGAMVVGGALTAAMLVMNSLLGTASALSSDAQVQQVAETLRMASLSTNTPLYSSTSGPQLHMAADIPPTPGGVSAVSTDPVDESSFSLGGKMFDLPENVSVTVVDHDTLRIHTMDGVVETQFDNDAVGGWFEPVSYTNQ